MAQLDSLIIFPLLFGLLVTLFLHYKFTLELTIPFFFCVSKFRKKKLESPFVQSSGNSFALSYTIDL